jgi:hypothetical protein
VFSAEVEFERMTWLEGHPAVHAARRAVRDKDSKTGIKVEA